MNSAVGPVNSAFVPCTVLICDFTVHEQCLCLLHNAHMWYYYSRAEKKKKKKKKKRGFGNAEPNPHLILKYRIKWMLPLNGLWWISKLWISFVVIFGDYLDLGILLKLIIDGKSVIGVNLNEWALELLFILKGA